MKVYINQFIESDSVIDRSGKCSAAETQMRIINAKNSSIQTGEKRLYPFFIGSAATGGTRQGQEWNFSKNVA
jgi:hypothetical protein